MDRRARGLQILNSAENELRELVATAALEGDYEDMSLLVSWAKSIRDLAKPCTIEERGTANTTRASRPRTSVPREPVAQQSVGKVQPSAGAARAYPRFLRDGNQIVKIGWSKREKSEYQHKAPRSVLMALGSVLCKIGADGRVFSSSEFVPLDDPAGNSEFPTYQTYVCLAFLRHTNIIEQHGRRGYSLPRAAGILDEIKTAWLGLSEQKVEE